VEIYVSLIGTGETALREGFPFYLTLRVACFSIRGAFRRRLRFAVRGAFRREEYPKGNWQLGCLLSTQSLKSAELALK